jgi:hypothetical protein
MMMKFCMERAALSRANFNYSGYRYIGKAASNNSFNPAALNVLVINPVFRDEAYMPGHSTGRERAGARRRPACCRVRGARGSRVSGGRV